MPKLSVTVITLQRGREHRGVSRVGRVGRRDPRRRQRQHRRHGRDRARAARRARHRPRLARLRARRRTSPPSEAAHDWILSVDADERVTPALAGGDPRRARRPTPAARASAIPRVTWHLGRWIRTTDWYPGLPAASLRPAARALDADGASTSRSRPTARSASSRNDLQHYAYRDISHHHQTMDRYTTLAAAGDVRRRAGARACSISSLHPPAAFLRNYVLRRGIPRRRCRASSSRR